MKIKVHSERTVIVEGIPNKIFEKHWDDIKKNEYIIVEGKKYYISYPRDLYEEDNNDKKYSNFKSIGRI